MVLTEAGRFLKSRAEEILSLTDQTMQAFEDRKKHLFSGHFTIGCVEAENSYLLTQIIEEMVTDHPKCLLLFLAELVMIFWKNLIKACLMWRF